MKIREAVLLSSVLSVALSAVLFKKRPGLPPLNGDHPKNQCPGTFIEGDRWKPRDDQCTECECTFKGYHCSSCGNLRAPIIKPGCYMESVPPSAPYPACCEQYLVCRGDKTFNEAKLEYAAMLFAER